MFLSFSLPLSFFTSQLHSAYACVSLTSANLRPMHPERIQQLHFSEDTTVDQKNHSDQTELCTEDYQ